MRYLISAIVVAIAAAASAAGPINPPARSDLEQLFESGQYPQFLKRVKPLADRGNTEAQYLLGKAYDLGKGVEKDVESARRWYSLAAENNHPRAVNNLGLIHLYNDGNAGEAVRNFERAIALGLKSHGTINLAAAHKELCLRDLTASCEDAGKLYLTLWDTEKKTSHLDDAVMVHGQRCFIYNDGEREKKGGVVKWSEPCRAAIALADKGVALGLGRSTYNRGAIELDGGHPLRAIPWFKLAVERGEGLGAYSLGKLYEDGKGVAKDKAEMLVWYKRGAALKNSHAVKRMKQYWDEQVESAANQSQIREAMTELGKLAPGENALLDAKSRIARMDILDANAKALPALSRQSIAPVFCPYANDWSLVEWWIVPISNDEDVDGMKRLATGTSNDKGCVRFSAADMAAMRKSMAQGHSLVLHWRGQGRLLQLQRGPKGTLEFLVQGNDHWDYSRP